MTEDVLARLRRLHEQATSEFHRTAAARTDAWAEYHMAVDAALPALLDVAEALSTIMRTHFPEEVVPHEHEHPSIENARAALARLRATTEEGTDG